MSLYAFCRDFSFAHVPAPTQAIVKKSVLDIVGVMAGAVSNQTTQALYRYARLHYPSGQLTSRLPFDGERVGLLGAGWAGGFSADSLDAHEGHFTSKGHAGATVVPALLALADALHHQGQPITGVQLLEALCLGYETGLRAGVSLISTSPTYHASGGFSAIGVVCGGARLLGLDEATFNHALGIAEYFSARCPMMRLIQHPTMLRDAHGAGAYVGLNALMMAREGITGAPAETVTADIAQPYWHDLGERWEIDAQYFKPWPVCRWAQPALTAMTALMAEHPAISADTVESIRVETFWESMCLQGHRPTDADQAQYALAFPLAALIARGQVGPNEVTGESIHAPDILAVSDRIEVVEAADISARFPEEILSRVRVTLKNAECFESPITAALGDPERPMTPADIDAKFDLFAGVNLSPPACAEVKRAVKSLESAASAIDALAPLFAPATR
ncbi:MULTISPECIES: MmgE/PrpD family protein [unclassified Pseudomonas]|uniref:MmgE/PrpD family protein n=1 Tax=unclassified Pseudomonas TaxID=196821 RepID=UPI000BD28D05|nr:MULTISPECIES: MmgE/PrpD family protein [unclassified Pseudomonas]PVZ11280.1 2-methylcitrate dehydratase PrpD [Pseudomonas sp. URIL14HWK12:I12]PVZ22278.1 2-methylcitrate dehydratase PrpD [Pseudomonas sp. URIL14HWK12:I10]PVZ31598.1 2-methylcitrate dehydratase PrpD [Pseudomonas sp. URIL14HWK12:I11]SNZ16609.1 2-methylcitrate dehydratase PrpD [Pseudomonas sp. URIL14HWK12:I9]